MHDLIQHVKDNTRQNSLLDLILSRPSEIASRISVDKPFSTSDHQKIAFSLSITCPKYFSKKVLIRSFKDVTFRKLDIARIDCDVVISLMFCSNDKYYIITATILELFNKHFSLKSINKVIRENYPQKIKELNKRKLLLFRKIKNGK